MPGCVRTEPQGNHLEDLRRVDRRQVTVDIPRALERRVSLRRATDAIKMACPFCGASESAVVRSRGAINEDVIRRRRECAECRRRFPTTELVDKETLARELAADERQRFQLVLPTGASNN